jgi:acyl-CoA synthetase (AMP-forming)/AMP-acid ligase II
MLLGKALARTARLRPEHTAIIYCDPGGGERSWTYRQLNARVNRLANALAALGLAKGQRVAVLSRNRPEYLEAYHALAKLGVVMVPLNHRLHPPDLARRLAHSGCRGLILEPEYLAVLEMLEPQVRARLGQRLLVLGRPGPRDGLMAYEQALGGAPQDEPDVDLHHEDPLSLAYTGGTTGQAKAAVISNRAIVVGYLYKAIEYGYDENEVALYPGPFWHTAPRNCSVAFYFGGTVVVTRGFDPRQYLELVQRHRVTSSFLVPTMYRAILELEGQEGYDTSSLQTLTSGGAPLPVELKRRVLERFGPVLYEHYASTETLILCTIGPEEMLERPRSVGRPVYDVHLKIVDDQDRPLPQGEAGEILIRCPSLLSGYFNDERANREAFRDGWFSLGDMGYQDADGYLYLVDRKKDMVISGGENIYPSEVEEVLRQHPAVDEAAVFGVPHPHWGEALKAAVVLRPGAEAGADELIAFCGRRLADYLKPKSVEFLEELPKSPVGKVLRRKLRDAHWNGKQRLI